MIHCQSTIETPKGSKQDSVPVPFKLKTLFVGSSVVADRRDLFDEIMRIQDGKPPDLEIYSPQEPQETPAGDGFNRFGSNLLPIQALG